LREIKGAPACSDAQESDSIVIDLRNRPKKPQVRKSHELSISNWAAADRPFWLATRIPVLPGSDVSAIESRRKRW
jgi:hypothetical protein